MQGGPLVFPYLVFLPLIFLATLIQVHASIPPSPADAKQTYIVYISQTPLLVGVEPEDYYIKSLIPILGSEQAAKDALVYSYKVLSGYVAVLTRDQASRLQKQPNILYVIKDVEHWLDDGSGV